MNAAPRLSTLRLGATSPWLPATLVLGAAALPAATLLLVAALALAAWQQRRQRAALADLHAAMERVASGDLTHSLDAQAVRGGLGPMGERLEAMQRIREVDQLLGEMAEGVRQVADRVREVATSTARQSHSVGEIAQAVCGIEQLTQRNMIMVDNSVGAAEQLRQQAANLKQGVLTMRLRQGCADEARALCERAVAALRSDGLLRAVQRFHDKAGGFIDRDLFVIVLDRQGHFRAFGADPSKADKPAVLPPGVDVQAVVQQTLAIADQGGGWLEFRSWHPVTRTPVDKMAFVMPWEDVAVMVSANRSDGG